MPKTFIFWGAINAALAVTMGAFGAHGLKSRLTTEAMAVYQTAFEYHSLHAVGLILAGLALHAWGEQPLLRWTGWLMLLGIFLFSGSLYALSISGIRWLGAITPLGGTAFIAAWLLFAVAALRTY